MKSIRLYLLALCALLCSQSWAVVTFTTNQTNTKIVVSVDNSCNAMMLALMTSLNVVASTKAPFKAYSCSDDPVLQTSTLILKDSLATPTTYYTTFTSWTNDATKALATWQDSINTQNAAISLMQTKVDSFIAGAASATGGGTSAQITVKDAFGTATPDEYAALSKMFGLILAAAAVIWGVKQIKNLLLKRPEA